MLRPNGDPGDNRDASAEGLVSPLCPLSVAFGALSLEFIHSERMAKRHRRRLANLGYGSTLRKITSNWPNA